MFLQADDHAAETVQRDPSQTPLTGPGTPLADAIRDERGLLAPIGANADLFIDTSRTNVHQLRDLVLECIGKARAPGFRCCCRSFGYKHGIPADADFVFDARCLPNPYWQPALRNLTGHGPGGH